MDLVCDRVLELLDERVREETVEVSAEFGPASRPPPGDPPARSPAGVSGRILIVPVSPCEGGGGAALPLERDGLRRPVVLEVHGVRFLPKLEVVAAFVQGWMDDFVEGARGVTAGAGGVCRVSAVSGGSVLYSKTVHFDFSDKPARRRKHINRISHEVMRVKSLCQNIVSAGAPMPPKQV